MIRVHRSDGMEILLNANLIKAVERGPQTIIHLTSGDKIAVKNTDRDVMQKIDAYRKGLRAARREEKKKEKSGK